MPQQIGSFTLVSRGTGLGIGVRVKKDDPTTVVTPTGTSAADEADDPRQPPAVVAMVFDALSAEGAQALPACGALQHQDGRRDQGADGGLLDRAVRPGGPAVHDRPRPPAARRRAADADRHRGQGHDRGEAGRRASAAPAAGFARPEPDPGVLARGRRRRRRRRRAERRHDRAGGGRPAPRPRRDADAPGVRLARPRPPRIQHHQLDHRGARVDGPDARPEERRVLLGRPARLPGAADAAAVAGRDREPLEHHDLRGRRQRFARAEQHGGNAQGGRGAGRASACARPRRAWTTPRAR